MNSKNKHTGTEKKLIKLKNFLDKTYLICYNIYVTNK